MWQHNYEPIAGSLGLSAAVAAIPIIVLFVMLGVLRKPAGDEGGRQQSSPARTTSAFSLLRLPKDAHEQHQPADDQ